MQDADEIIGSAFRTIIREELDAAFARRDAAVTPRVKPRPDSKQRLHALPGVDRFSLVPHVEHALGEASGGPMHCADIAERVYALGFEHKWPPKYPDQLIRSINALASPSQHPEKFERVGPRILQLKAR